MRINYSFVNNLSRAGAMANGDIIRYLSTCFKYNEFILFEMFN